MPPGCRPANPSGTVGGEETWKRINAGKDMDRYRRYMKDQIGELLTIYGCTEEKFVAPPGTVLTFNPATRRLYIHLLAYPGGRLACPFAADVAYAQFLHDASEITLERHGTAAEQTQEFYKSGNEGVSYFLLPAVKPPVLIPVIEVALK